MKVFQVSRTIHAAPDAVWTVLADGDRYIEWDPTLERLEGSIAPGETLKVFTRLSPGRAFPVKVTAFEPGRRMIWTGGMPLGLFKGERTFTLSSSGNTTTFTMREEFTGLLAPLISKSIPDLQPAFEQFANGLKARVEGSL